LAAREGSATVREGSAAMREGSEATHHGSAVTRGGNAGMREGGAAMRKGCAGMRESDAGMRDGGAGMCGGGATGHGLNAGHMVTATKGLLNVLSTDESLDKIFETSNRAIKQMNFHMLTMCLTIIRLGDRKIEYASAGMPPMLIYRRDSHEVEEIVLKAMPLGAFVE